ncbi:MAG: sigma-70 family RNA polymerase sigma factor [Planctomycetes bacterium]|nr:sigma-70 family RNA polymerase sigma factor [Planctomycetota bacterium]
MHQTYPADEDLAREAAAGRRDAFEALVARFGSSLLAVIGKQVNDHHAALDLAQEVWVKVFRAMHRYRPEGSFRSWLFSIALNHVRDALRQRQRRREVCAGDLSAAPAAGGWFDPRGRSDEAAAIEAALERVPEPFRSALCLVDVLDFSYEEAARSLDCAVGTVKSRVNRGRFAFRDQYLKAAGGLAGRASAPGACHEV